ncbi:hypothetical protein KDA_22880 [Dictyobacter alpinus]|uniref:Uncharacterized protein n=1 Tax=Dictyobacter alpinus TaxID=2014873 RepID=A0A402B633_9CHLR|nr:hypothetical protein [Dictyobacter alpinus]GCE26804.1 hypothetical protein KDA_22880 [Dictyobacter alpinus]
MSQAQIQTYASCNQETFLATLQRYRQALELLGCKDQNVLDWINAISWPENDDDPFGDIYAAPVLLTPPGAPALECSGIEISLYTQPAVPSLEDLPPWIGFNLLVETEQLHEDENNIEPYSSEVGQSIWQILQVLAHEFTEVGAYFTDEWQENQSWRVIIENAGDPWIFYLGIFPRRLAEHFERIPSGYLGTLVDAGFGFAQINRWQTIPWETTAPA